MIEIKVDEEDIEMFDNLLHFDTVPKEYKERLKRMIEEVEK